MPRQFGDKEYQELFDLKTGTGYAPGAIEMSNAAYSRRFSEAAGYPQRAPGAPVVQPLPQAATGAIDPRGIVQGKLGELRSSFQQQARSLKQAGLDAETHNRILSGWQNEYDEAKAQLTGARTQLGLIHQGIQSGEMTKEAGREAAIRMIVPKETADLMFPSMQRPQRGRFTPGEFTSYVDAFKDIANPAIKRPWLSRNYVEPDELKGQYFQARAQYAYDTDMNTTEQKAFDLAWDQAMKSRSLTAKAWKKMMNEDPDLFTSRTYDARLLKIAADKARGSVSPLARAMVPKPKPNQRKYGALNFRPQQEQEPMVQRNKRTGQTRVSYDGGTTWQTE